MKKKILTALAVIALVFLVLAGFLVQRYGPVYGPLFIGRPIYVIEPGYDRYGEIAFQYMDQAGFYKDSPQWQASREDHAEDLAAVTSEEELLEEMNEALKVAGGKHSFAIKQSSSEEVAQDYLAPSLSFEDDLLYLTLPAYSGSGDLTQDYADTLIEGFKAHPNPAGIIVDLRGNNGGDMGPMIAGLSPLITDGEILTFVYGQAESQVKLEEGSIQGGGSPVTVENLEKIRDVPVAVLIDGDTASSAEMTALALMEEENVQTFGQSSRGLTSVNNSINLTNDILEVLTIGYVKTRSGDEYMEIPIHPDLVTDDPVAAAKEWIQAS